MAEPMQRYQFRLAERLGFTVAQLRGSMTMAEFRDWIAYDRLEQMERGQ